MRNRAICWVIITRDSVRCCIRKLFGISGVAQICLTTRDYLARRGVRRRARVHTEPCWLGRVVIICVCRCLKTPWVKIIIHIWSWILLSSYQNSSMAPANTSTRARMSYTYLYFNLERAFVQINVPCSMYTRFEWIRKRSRHNTWLMTYSAADRGFPSYKGPSDNTWLSGQTCSSACMRTHISVMTGSCRKHLHMWRSAMKTKLHVIQLWWLY